MGSQASGWDALGEVRIGLALDSWHPTVGTRITGQRNTARRLVISHGQLALIPHPAPEATWDFPAPFGRQDVVELPFSRGRLPAHALAAAPDVRARRRRARAPRSELS